MRQSFFLCLILFFTFGVSSGFAEEAASDSVDVVQPKFSMTPT